tara:strand:- start:1457 stop:1804 length:348 start_codon:yes stop_codon:yes gene_type:complete
MALRNLIDLTVCHFNARIIAGIILAIALSSVPASRVVADEIFLSPETESTGPDIQIVIGENKTVYEYRSNGVLIAIKVVPKLGRPYYMVPADGSPHFESLDHAKALYPQWVLFEW